jgi:hypothetical protein
MASPLRIPAALFLLSLAMAGCNKDDDQPVRQDRGTDYFPLGTGRWIEYAVDSIWRNDVGAVHDTVSYALRELQFEAFTDLEGRPAQRLHRLRHNGTDWTLQDVWWQTRTVDRAERSEEDQRRVKLLFPPSTGRYWNTNSTNGGEAYELTYQEVDVPWTVNGMTFDSTLLVKTTYPNNLVVARTYYERYAKHIGLVYREVDSTNTQYNSSTGQYQVRGTWYKQVITAHGQ